MPSREKLLDPPAAPPAPAGATPALRVGPEQRLQLYRWMRTARAVDLRQKELTAAGDAFFHLPSSGHEGAAALGLFLRPSDWVHGHYRDKAIQLARGFPVEQFFHSLLSNAEDASRGRMMGCFHGNRELNLPSTVVPVGNHALQAVGIAAELKDRGDTESIVLCGMGDGTTQQGEVYEAIAEAVRAELPVLFYVEDNGYAISTQTTRQTFFELPTGPAESFLGLPLHRFDTLHLAPQIDGLGDVVRRVRLSRGPAIAVLRCERLTNHTNADDQRVYRTPGDLADAAEQNDPVANYRAALIEAGDAEPDALERLDTEIDTEVNGAVDVARRTPEPQPVFTAKRELPDELTDRNAEYTGSADGNERVMMIEAMRGVLRHHLETDSTVTLLGEDIEDPKGDVFGVTRGLSTDFPGRVRNSALAESTIVGTAIGRAMAGGRPVGFVQFADFLPNGINQVLSELGTIYWRTAGQFECPVILMITCGGYRPGLGPFHAQTLESILAHVPGIDVYMPSDAGDAAGLLNAAFKSKRPTVFLYPKVCLNDRARTTSPDLAGHLVPPGTARRLREGDDLTLVAWGSTVSIATDAADTITQQSGRTVDLFDLRSIEPWDRDAITKSAERTGKLIVVHEDNLTAGFGAEVVAHVTEALSSSGVALRAARVTRPDTPIPQNFANQLEILPSYRRTLRVCCEVLGLKVAWPDDDKPVELGDIEVIEAQGSSPADQVVGVTEWKCKPGDRVRTGDILADLEADKAVFEYACPLDGVVEEVLVPEGEQVDVGTPILKLRRVKQAGGGSDATDAPVVKRVAREDKGRPVITEAGASAASSQTAGAADHHSVAVYLSPIHVTEGSQRLTNDDLIRRFAGRTSDDIVKRTGIESRPMMGPEQSALSMAVDAASAALDAEGLTLDDLTGIVCHTTTPRLNTPSMACLVLNALDEQRRGADASLSAAECMVYDVNAACSGWLYALDAAYNTVRDAPHSAVLVVTTEAMSRIANPKDFDTAILLGDAATATVVRGCVTDPGGNEPPDIPTGSLRLTKPVLSGKADPQKLITVGFEGQGHFEMEGKKVFVEGVRAMTTMTTRAFAAVGRDVNDCDWLVPHQANRRIFEAVRKKLDVPPEKVIDMIAEHGNTSSSSIPLSISKRAGDLKPGQTVGLCAFGGGFTFGAAILEVV